MTGPEIGFLFQDVWHFFARGGFFMVPLLACSIVSVTIMFLRHGALKVPAVIPGRIEREIEDLRPGESPARVARVARGDSSSLARVVRVALHHLRWPRAENAEAVQTRARKEMAELERGLVTLEIIVGIAPLLGLLGTVSGLGRIFASIGMSSGAAAEPQVIALGIAEALNTTILGLVVAIPTLIAHSHFTKRIEGLAIEMESLVADLLAKCYPDQTTSSAGLAYDLAEVDGPEDATGGGRDGDAGGRVSPGVRGGGWRKAFSFLAPRRAAGDEEELLGEGSAGSTGWGEDAGSRRDEGEDRMADPRG